MITLHFFGSGLNTTPNNDREKWWRNKEINQKTWDTTNTLRRTLGLYCKMSSWLWLKNSDAKQANQP